jgi:hypothetical protein
MRLRALTTYVLAEQAYSPSWKSQFITETLGGSLRATGTTVALWARINDFQAVEELRL